LGTDVGSQVDDCGPRLGLRPGERQLGFVLRPLEAVALGAAGLAVEALDLMRLGGGRAEQQHLPPGPAGGPGRTPRQVVDHDLLPAGTGRREDHHKDTKDTKSGERDYSFLCALCVFVVNLVNQILAYLILAPTGTSASKVHSTALPSCEAASTMPFDS